MLQSVNSFIDYYEGIRRRTLSFIHVIPADKIDWSPAEGEFTFGDLVRHLAAAERMFVGAVVDSQWKYAGHESLVHQDLDNAVSLLNTCQGSTHREHPRLITS